MVQAWPEARARRRLAFLLVPLLSLVCLLGPAPCAPASDGLRAELGDLAGEIKELLGKEGQAAVAVGQFTGPRDLPASGPLIRKVLAEELRSQGVRAGPGAGWTVRGDYAPALAEPTAGGKRPLGVQIIARVLDDNGFTVGTFARMVPGNKDLLVLLGATVAHRHLPGARGAKGAFDPDTFKRNEDVREAAGRQTRRPPHIEGTRVAASADSPYAVEVRAKTPDGYIAVKPEVCDGQAFVPLEKGQEYSVFIFNRSGRDAAVALTIDGLSMFAFSKEREPGAPERPRFGHVICRPGDRPTAVLGWHVTNERSDAFEVTSYARSAAAELGAGGEVGTITATFAAAWSPATERPPEDEPVGAKGANVPDLATGRGGQIGSRFKEVDRTLGVVREAVSVRYVK